MKHIKKFDQIFEYRNQLEIPFDDKHPLHDKPTHVHILDALTEMDKENGVNISTYKSHWSAETIKDEWEREEYKALCIYREDEIDSIRDYERNIIRDFYMEEYPPSTDKEIYNEDIIKYVDENHGDIYLDDDIVDEFDLDGESIGYYLSDLGHSKEEDAFMYLFRELQSEFKCKKTLMEEITEDGLIPLYRAVNYGKGDTKDAYLNILKHGGTGIYWSFEYDGAVDYCSEGGGDTYILCAYIKPEYINWEQTILKSGYKLRPEREVELFNNEDIMIKSIIEQKTGKKIQQDKPFIIKT